MKQLTSEEVVEILENTAHIEDALDCLEIRRVAIDALKYKIAMEAEE